QKGLPSTARVITNHFRVLLEVLPALLDVTLPDDTPAANAETKDWIENFVIIQSAPPPEPTESTEGGESTESSEETPADSYSTDDTASTEAPSWETPADSESTAEPEATPEL